MNAEQLLFALLRHTVCGQPLDEDIKNSLTPELLSSVYDLSQKHDLAHIVGHALHKLGALGEDEASQKLKKVSMQAVYRYMQMDYEYGRICSVLEEAELPFLPMKGAILRGYYPEPWMRTSCDIDLLVKAENVRPVIDCLTEKLQYQFKEQFFCEYSLYSPGGVHLEVHSDAEIMESTEPKEKILAQIWSAVSPAEGAACGLVMPEEMFYYYHIMHMAKHFSGGGCGVRPFLDIWVLTHRKEFCREKCEAMLAQGGLLTFAREAEKLSEAWFSCGAKDALTDRMGAYILDAGVYGSLENHIAIKQSQRGGKLKFILSRLFLPWEKLKLQYPILYRHKWLLPVFEIVRWGKLLTSGKARRSAEELKINSNVSSEKVAQSAQLMQQLGL